MHKIFKYKLEFDKMEVLMPVGAKILSFQSQGGIPCIWALVNTNAKKHQLRKFFIVGTGEPMTSMALAGLEYIGTAQMSLYLVYHLFEVVR